MLHIIGSDTPFYVVFLDLWEPWDIPYQDIYCNILTCLYCMTVFGIGSTIVFKEITSDHFSQWYFGSFFVPFGIPKIVVVDADGLFLGFPRKLSRRPY